MRTRDLLVYLLLVPIVGIFLYGIVTLLILRYETGDIYPPYSSLRADPLGTKALYEGIDNVNSAAARRNYQPLEKLKDLNDVALIYAGVEPNDFSVVAVETATMLERLLERGNRIVFAFFPVENRPFSRFGIFEEDEEAGAKKEGDAPEQGEPKPESAPQEDPQTGEKTPSNDQEAAAWVSLAERWGVVFDYIERPINTEGKEVFTPARRQVNMPQFPDEISWHTVLYFTPSADQNWRVLYTFQGQPVLIERDFGKGTLVLSADSYFLSNEAMRNERHSDLLVWLIGLHPEIVFDETHLGVMETPGIAALIRKYRLGWFVAGSMLLALLFVWKNASSFVPPPQDALKTAGEAGQNAMAGLVNLLRQNIAAQDIVSVCVQEWEKSTLHHRHDRAKTLREIQTVLDAEQSRPSRSHNPVKCYQTISQILTRR